jgi:hypothetical protein
MSTGGLSGESPPSAARTSSSLTERRAATLDRRVPDPSRGPPRRGLTRLRS